MIELIRSLFKEGDFIRIFVGQPPEWVEGRILSMPENNIALETNSGEIRGFKGGDISSFGSQSHQNKLPTDVETAEQNVIRQNSVEVEGDKQENGHQENDFNRQKEKKSNSQTAPKKKFTKIGNSFSALGPLVEKEHKIANLNVVPALGEVIFIDVSKGYGFIADGKTRKELYFSLSQIVGDPNSPSLSQYAPVVYSLQVGSTRALTVHRPMPIETMLKMASDFEKNGEHSHALNLVEQILREYPDNFDADDFKTKISSFNEKKREWYSNYYVKARRYDTEKKYPEAIKNYLMAIERGEKIESAVKDLGQLYVQLYKSEIVQEKAEEYRKEAIQFMEKYSSELPDTITTWNYLENFYYSVGVFTSYVEVVDTLLDYEEIIKDESKYVTLLYKKSLALVQLNNIEEAKETISAILEIDPQYQYALNLKSIIENNPNDATAIILAEDFIMNVGGMSSFIRNTIDNYDEYTGVPAKIIESGEFNEATLRAVHNLVETAGVGRARERAKYLLTEAKLITILEPDNTERLRGVMARYCNAMALNHISDHSSRDIIRFYYNEAFALGGSYEGNKRQVALYLLTFIHDYGELLKIAGDPITVDHALEEVVGLGYDAKRWESILLMLLYNGAIFDQITSKLYKNPKFRSLSLRVLEGFGIKDLSTSMVEDEFKKGWNKARETRNRDYRLMTTQIKALGASSNLDGVCSQLSLLRDMVKEWVTSIDEKRINTIVMDICPAIETYLKSAGYRFKENNKNIAVEYVEQLIDEIKGWPTKLSYDAMLPLLERINHLIYVSFEDVIKISAPKIDIKLLSSETVVSDNNEVSIHISVSNHKDSSPITDVSIRVLQTEMVKMTENNEAPYSVIDGGENVIFKLKIRVNNEVIVQKATTLDIICGYKTGNDEREFSSRQSLRLYTPDDYCQIENPYSPLADGGPVPLDSNMFYGREEFISNIVESIVESPSKQIIIYGQKRCGKSSVMLHLKKELMETGKTFCVFFSLGEIIGNLTEATFYHKILTSITDELEHGQLEGRYTNVPRVEVPSVRDFLNEDEFNPLNTFMKYMIKFKTSCKNTQGWGEKDLVVMIDEFTYLYSGIKNGQVSASIMKQWKAITQNEGAKFSVVLVGQDVIPSFKNEDYARNAFGVIQDVRLTYLKEGPARELIVRPILDSNGNSRYIEGAVSKIIEYTSNNPYYIQIFCSRLVDYMNENKLVRVTEADVENVARSFVVGSDALGLDKFDNLIRAGESEDLQEFSEDNILLVLRQISQNSKNIGYCSRDDINILKDRDEEDKIFKHLTDREVLEKRGNNIYKIQVKLFQEWLLNH